MFNSKTLVSIFWICCVCFHVQKNSSSVLKQFISYISTWKTPIIKYKFFLLLYFKDFKAKTYTKRIIKTLKNNSYRKSIKDFSFLYGFIFFSFILASQNTSLLLLLGIYVPYHFPIILICWYKYSYTQCKVSYSFYFLCLSFPRCNTQKYKIKIYTKGFSPLFPPQLCFYLLFVESQKK